MGKVVAVLFAAVVVLKLAECMQYCKVNDDCSDLGGLVCIKSICEWGMCGCARGKVSRYMGSVQKYQCVAQKRVGDACSTDGGDGVCGAPNTECKENKCTCKTNYVSRFNGEYCLPEGHVYPSEMASGDMTSCQRSTSKSSSSYDPRKIIDYNPISCACSQGSKTVLSNAFGENFQGRKVPACVSLVIGDMCIVEADCTHITGGTCTSNKCACKTSGEVAQVGGTTCGKALGHGSKCTGVAGSVCDGTKGLVCNQGEYCFAGDLTSVVSTCVCHYTYKTSGTTCTKRKIGDTCNGDRNCKGVANAICVDGTCQNGSTTMVASMSLMMVMSYLAFFFAK